MGSNLGDRFGALRAARARLADFPGREGPLLASSIYETQPIDCEPGAAMFLNAVIEIGYTGTAELLLGELRQIENALGRPAAHARNASRTLDLDLLYFGDLIVERSDLQLPHPRLHARRFVLEPLAEIRPELILPGQIEEVAKILRSLPDRSPLLRVATEW